ncbi:MAG: exonuclease domain-containing protein [Gammaproteobacteria bacterium]|nr:exonuclease domain-containing protein [Gammaproteobacteria bacterium]
MQPIDAPLAGEVACVDLETTGGNALRDRVMEVGIVLLSGDRVVEEYSTLVNPGVRIPFAIQQFTGITDDMVADAPPFAAVCDDILRRLEGRLFVAHNARFDYGFLRGEFRRMGRRFRAPVLCTVRLSRALTPGERGHNLDAVMARYGIHCAARHRALGDAQVLAELLRIARGRWPPAELDPIVKHLMQAPRLPPQLDAGLVDELPEGPGVYLFHGEGDALLYVGKAKNIQSRVLAHFAANQRSRRATELSRLVRRIEWIATAGEFGALITEARLIKERRPLLNRRLRESPTLWAIRLVDDAERLRVGISELDPDTDGNESYGMFRSRGDAGRALTGMVRDHALCARQLGLEEGDGSCFAFQLGHCRGACIGKEPALVHSVRVRLAFARLKRRDWPFSGPVGMRERDWSGAEEVHVFDRWCYLGSFHGGAEPEDLQRSPGHFDQDIYRILLRAFERPTRGLQMIELGRS